MWMLCPWNDPKVGYPAMAEKTAKRRLARIVPFEINKERFLKAARLDEAHDEQGLYSRIGEQATVITEPEGSIAPRVEGTPSLQQMTGPKTDPELERLKSKATSFPSLWTRSTRALATWWTPTWRPNVPRCSPCK